MPRLLLTAVALALLLAGCTADPAPGAVENRTKASDRGTEVTPTTVPTPVPSEVPEGELQGIAAKAAHARASALAERMDALAWLHRVDTNEFEDQPDTGFHRVDNPRGQGRPAGWSFTYVNPVNQTLLLIHIWANGDEDAQEYPFPDPDLSNPTGPVFRPLEEGSWRLDSTAVTQTLLKRGEYREEIKNPDRALLMALLPEEDRLLWQVTSVPLGPFLNGEESDPILEAKLDARTGEVVLFRYDPPKE
ncbi:MAG TPA: hypothetical protein VNZ52_01790 [Candidatus Thermoplasmatota archaeon]|nr:hypothetical protein [Candidatus Thermoplasmatota archaeon]